MFFPCGRKDTTATADEITGIQKGTKAVYVYGEVRYDDIFQKTWVLKYRYLLIGAMGLVKGGAAISAYGNEEYQYKK